jgi:two-component system NarL family sensor kinase
MMMPIPRIIAEKIAHGLKAAEHAQIELTNAHKHSRATRLDIALHRKKGSTVLRVTDDGIGFDPEILDRRVAEGHIGLASLIVGVEATGGSVDFSPRPGGGTVVTVTVPDEVEADRLQPA